MMTHRDDPMEDEEPHLTEMIRQAETRHEDDGYWED